MHRIASFLAVLALVRGQTESSACQRLKGEHGLDCNACLASLPEDEEPCKPRTAADDFAAETKALFPRKKVSGKFNRTSFLWNTEAVWPVSLNLTKANWLSLTDAPAAEEYVSATITIGDLGSWDVGVRFKGFYGSLRHCLVKAKCKKLSYKVNFQYNDKDENQTFFGMKKLQFHASLSDRTKLREHLAFSMLREMGVAAPRQAFSDMQLHLDGEESISLGFHLLTEVVDSKFTEAYFPKGDGNLYKEAWPGMSAASLKEQLETNKKEKDVSRMLEFQTALEGASDDYELAMVVKQFMHVDKMAAYLAVDRAIENVDGPIHFRHDGTYRRESSTDFESAFFTHNFFLYEDDPDWKHAANGTKFQIVGWDLDLVYSYDTGFNQGSSAGLRPDWDAPLCPEGPTNSSKCTMCTEMYRTTRKTSWSLGPSCFPVFRAFSRGLRQYTMEAAKNLLAGPLQPCRINAKLDRWINIIQPLLERDQENNLWPELLNPGGSGANGAKYMQDVDVLREDVMPFWTERYKSTLACDRAAVVEPWNHEILHPGIVPMPRVPGAELGGVGWVDGNPTTALPKEPLTFVTCLMTRCPVFLACCDDGSKCAKSIKDPRWHRDPPWVRSVMAPESCFEDAMTCACSRCFEPMRTDWQVVDRVCPYYPKPEVSPPSAGLCATCATPESPECGKAMGGVCMDNDAGSVEFCGICSGGLTDDCVQAAEDYVSLCDEDTLAAVLAERALNPNFSPPSGASSGFYGLSPAVPAGGAVPLGTPGPGPRRRPSTPATSGQRYPGSTYQPSQPYQPPQAQPYQQYQVPRAQPYQRPQAQSASRYGQVQARPASVYGAAPAQRRGRGAYGGVPQGRVYG